MNVRNESASCVCSSTASSVPTLLSAHAFGQADVIAGVGDEGVVAGAYRQLPAQQVETVVDVVMHVERRGGAGTDVVLDDDRERALG